MNNRPWWVAALHFVGIGWYIAISMVAGTLGGVWLDGRLGSSPLFLLIGLLLGVMVAFYGAYRMMADYLALWPNSKNRGKPKS